MKQEIDQSQIKKYFFNIKSWNMKQKSEKFKEVLSDRNLFWSEIFIFYEKKNLKFWL